MGNNFCAWKLPPQRILVFNAVHKISYQPSLAHSPRRKPAYAGVLHEDVGAAPQAVHSTFLVPLYDAHVGHNDLGVELPDPAAYVGT